MPRCFIVVCLLAALAVSGCMRRPSPVANAQPRGDLDAYAYGGPVAVATPAPTPPSRGLFTSGPSTNSGGGALAALGAGFRSGAAAMPSSVSSSSPRNAYAQALPVAYAAPQPAADPDYRVDAGDRLRVVVYGQEGLTNSYAIDASGAVTLPLIGAVPARGRTVQGLADEIGGRLRNGFIREPSVAVEIESYRPFFILGEVAAPGQYPYVPRMTVESAVAIAGGFSPRARRDRVTLTHNDNAGGFRAVVSPGSPLSPGDTILVGERWF